jgi:hypothetical protein
VGAARPTTPYRLFFQHFSISAFQHFSFSAFSSPPLLSVFSFQLFSFSAFPSRFPLNEAHEFIYS